MLKLAAQSSRALLDLLILSAAYWLAYLLRFDWDLPYMMLKRLVFTWPYVVGVQYFLLVLSGVPRFAWRQVGLREAIRIGYAAALAAAILLGARFLSPVVIPVFGYALYAFIPIGIILIDGTAAFLGITGLRVLSRIFAEKAHARQRKQEGQPRRIPTLLVGAGQAGSWSQRRSRPVQTWASSPWDSSTTTGLRWAPSCMGSACSGRPWNCRGSASGQGLSRS